MATDTSAHIDDHAVTFPGGGFRRPRRGRQGRSPGANGNRNGGILEKFSAGRAKGLIGFSHDDLLEIGWYVMGRRHVGSK